MVAQKRILNARFYGEGQRKLIILHGLFGSARNWTNTIKEMQFDGQIIALDARNHGDSFHDESHTLDDLIEDLFQFICHHNIELFSLLGHSMGGLTAMGFALRYPHMIHKMIIEDISPKAYKMHFDRELDALVIDVSQFNNRYDIDKAFSKVIYDLRVRQFFQTNVVRTKSGNYQWRINVDALINSEYANEFTFPDSQEPSPVETLFLQAEYSPYMQDKDKEIISKLFPNSTVKLFKAADHWLHISADTEFLETINSFLKS